MAELCSVDPAGNSVWRVGRNTPDVAERYAYRRPDPVVAADGPLQGNRFDSYFGRFGVLYFGASPEVCFAETLGRFRPKTELADRVREEWAELGWMLPGNMPADWRARRIITCVRFPGAAPLVDIRHPDTLAWLNEHDTLMSLCQTVYDVEEIDLATVCGPDRRVTRLIAEYINLDVDDEGNGRWGGIIYHSRLGTTDEGHHDCWAIFEDTEIEEIAQQSILRTNDDLCRVADRYNLIVH